MSRAAEVVVDASQNHRAPKACRFRDDLIARQPKRAHNPAIELPLRFVVRHDASERNTQKAAGNFRLFPQVNAD
jgi:hypothetical protein